MRHVLVMGVCGTGKSSVAAPLADHLNGTFVEADTHHAPEAILRMARGEPLQDVSRWDWIERIATAALAAPGTAVIACSALKRAYRDRLAELLGPLFVIHLQGSKELVAARMAARPDHFMPASLIDSQFADLEAPEGPAVLTADIARPLDEIVADAHFFVTGTRLRA